MAITFISSPIYDTKKSGEVYKIGSKIVKVRFKLLEEEHGAYAYDQLMGMLTSTDVRPLSTFESELSG